MPSSTFFNLPQEKRTRLLAAAREEFSRVPYDEASINRMIRAAGIPRGSFYMYFADKEDLFRHLLEDYVQHFVQLLQEVLREEKGDLFAAFSTLYDRVTGRGENGDRLAGLQALLRLNAGPRQGPLLRSMAPRGLLEQLLPEIDPSRLSLLREGDLEEMIHILVGVTMPALCAAAEQDLEAVRERYRAQLDILSRGMTAHQAVSPTY